MWHDGLLFKLSEFGISGSLLEWFRSFLSDRKQRVIVEGEASVFLPIKAGVPQGSVLGPILFLIFINDLFDEVTNNFDVFADDSTLWTVIPTPSDRISAAASLNTDLVAIQAWANKWIVTYNHTKTELMTTSNRSDCQLFRKNALDPVSDQYLPSPNPNPHPPIVFNGCTLGEASSFKLTGLTFTPTLSWKKHISNVYLHANRNIALLRRASLVLKGPALATIYKSHIRSRLEYCSPIWMGNANTALAKLNKIQDRASRILGNHEALRLQSLHHRRVVSGMCILHRIIKKTAPAALHFLCPARFEGSIRLSRNSTRFPLYFKQPNMRKPTYTI